jgi:hypothetical protein
VKSPTKSGRPATRAKEASKKTVSKKVSVRATIKKALTKSSKPKTVLKAKAKASKQKATSGGTKYQVWVAEAIQQLKTPEHEYVSFGKIKQYLLDYLDTAAFRIPKLAKQALLQLLGTKIVKAKRDSYAFTKAGEAKIAPKTVGKREKIEREAKVVAKSAKEEPAKKVVILRTGRVSKPRTIA